ncbi:class F sortase [Blastococcus sp. BMG 814]|uniref:Class F sortase n=1 Tax=Blastococcus carthaginiensis TaxID=3050034 RepID=A0ABT9IEV1_9ACTN|nr:class F sortase [Blastococcus carthaginiensis]MDP5184083.1 class F sortase [Blastococcus carthaginiensis]
MRPTRGPDLRTVAAFVVVLATGLAVLWVVTARPPAGDDVFALSEQAAAGPIEPAWLAIPAIGVDTPVEHRGTVTYDNPFTGRTVEGYGVPESMLTTSWWSDGPAPGSGRMAVVLGHQQDGGDAVFDRLHELAPGDEVVLRDAGGAVLRLTVLGEPLTGLDKATSALSDALNGHPAEADVALVTCGGEFDDAAGTSTENTVVFATVAGGA